jgi:hypothetical protein
MEFSRAETDFRGQILKPSAFTVFEAWRDFRDDNIAPTKVSESVPQF